MMIEVQELQEQMLELRVRTAIGGNKLARLDTPLLDVRIRTLKRKAQEALGIDAQDSRGHTTSCA